MYIEKLTIKNFRCFADAEVYLNYPGRKARRGEKIPKHFDNVTLFIGPNGSGKTTIFKAVCLTILAPVIANSGLRVDYFVRRQAGDTVDVQAHDFCNITSKLLLDESDALEAVPLPWNEVEGTIEVELLGDTERLRGLVSGQEAWTEIYQSNSPAFFLTAYGSNRRAANPEGYTDRSRSARYQRVSSVFEEYAGLIPFSYGFFQLTRLNRLWEAVRILNSLLPDDVRVTEHLDHEGNPLFESFGVRHPFAALSDGYRGFISWVWDLFVQIARVLPSNASSNAFAQMSGVVIVDEIDLFLHPRWQRILIEELAHQFPNLQFLFSTHSPLVAGMLDSEHLRALERNENSSTIAQYREPVEGKTPNELLTSVYFGLSSTRSPRSGTISEQVEKEMANGDKPESTTTRRTKPISDHQNRDLVRMMAQSREYVKAVQRAELEEPKPE